MRWKGAWRSRRGREGRRGRDKGEEEFVSNSRDGGSWLELAPGFRFHPNEGRNTKFVVRENSRLGLVHGLIGIAKVAEKWRGGFLKSLRGGMGDRVVIEFTNFLPQLSSKGLVLGAQFGVFLAQVAARGGRASDLAADSRCRAEGFGCGIAESVDLRWKEGAPEGIFEGAL